MIDILPYLKEKINESFQRMNSLIIKGKILKVDKNKCRAKFFGGETHQNLERFQSYGLFSNPPVETDGICLFFGGDRRHGVLIAEKNHFFDIPVGDVVLYGVKDGKPTVKIHMMPSTDTVEVTAKNVLFKGNIEAKEITCQTIKDKKGSLDSLRKKYNLHTHKVSGNVTTPTENIDGEQ